MKIREIIQNNKVASAVTMTSGIAFLCSFLAPLQAASEVIIMAGIVWALWMVIRGYQQNPYRDLKDFWLKETVSYCFYASAGVIFVLQATPIGKRVGPEHTWVANTIPLSQYTTPYLVPVVLFTVFLVLFFGADCLNNYESDPVEE